MTPVPVFIPFVNRPDLLEKAVDSIPLSNNWQVEIIDNSNGILPTMDVCAGDCNPPVPLTFAQSQNWMLKLAESWGGEGGTPFYFFMHSDAEAGEGTMLRLFAMAHAYTTQKRKWGAIFTAYDALAAFNTEAMRDIGGWDPLLPWYFADNNTYRKLRLAGYELIESNLPVKHEPSQTLKSDEYLAFVNSLTFPFYERLYTKMWGGPPGKELFPTPFNR